MVESSDGGGLCDKMLYIFSSSPSSLYYDLSLHTMDCISGLDWVEIWHWFYWYYTGYAGLVSQMYIEYTHTHTEQSNRFDRLYITSHEWIHTNSFTHTNFHSFFLVSIFVHFAIEHIFFLFTPFHFSTLAASTMCHHDGMTQLTLLVITFFILALYSTVFSVLLFFSSIFHCF